MGSCAGIRRALCPWSGSRDGFPCRIGVGAFFGCEIAGVGGLGVSVAESAKSVSAYQLLHGATVVVRNAGKGTKMLVDVPVPSQRRLLL